MNAPGPAGEPDEVFGVEDGFLVRRVATARGTAYQHRCPLAAFEAVAHAIDEAGDAGFLLADLVKHANVPSSQAATAFAFLRERGVVERTGRRRSLQRAEELRLTRAAHSQS